MSLGDARFRLKGLFVGDVVGFVSWRICSLNWHWIFGYDNTWVLIPTHGTTKATIAKIWEKEPNYFCLAKSECAYSVESIRRRIAAHAVFLPWANLPIHVTPLHYTWIHVNFACHMWIRFLSEQICPSVHIIYALFIYLFLRTKNHHIHIQNISHIHAICPVTSERYYEVTGHLRLIYQRSGVRVSWD